MSEKDYKDGYNRGYELAPRFNTPETVTKLFDIENDFDRGVLDGYEQACREQEIERLEDLENSAIGQDISKEFDR